MSEPPGTGRWPAARALFDAALALPEPERAAFVAARAGADLGLRDEVLSLLSSLAGAGQFLAGEEIGAVAPAAEDDAGERPRERIGPWRVVKELGRGGMGVVYLAERAAGDFDQRVAIKVVSGGVRSGAIVRRFETERRLLAALEHPGIARLLDGGTTEDGLPYFVLEHVEGEELLAFADGKRLDVPARIRLFLEVCAAVEHAHRRLVIHRDLKPSNILVGADGRPRLLDFGIGKLLSPEGGAELARTSTLERWYTPRYASPEQILGQPTTTATDVYGLGLVLYELLCGAPPHRFRGTTPREIESAVLERTPRRLSLAVMEPDGAAERAARRSTSAVRLRRQLRGDLDNIVARALEREPARRYASVAELGADLARFLEGRPVSARPVGAPERFRKLLLRHRGASVTIAAALLVLVGFVVYHAITVERERNAARREAANATEIAAFLTQLFQGSNQVQTGGAVLSARDLLNRGEERIAERTDLDPTVRGRLLTTMSLARESLDDLARAHELARRAVELHEAAGSPAEDRVFARLLLAKFLVVEGHGLEALPIVERAAALAEANPDVTLKTRAKVTLVLGNCYYLTGDEERAKAAYLRHYETEKQIGSPARIGAALNNLGAVVANMGDKAGARAYYREAVGSFERSDEKVAYEIYLPLYNLGELELEAGELVAAETHLRRGIAAYEKVFGAESSGVAWGNASIAEIERQRGELDRARRSVDRALAIYGKVLEPGMEDWSWALLVSGRIHHDAGDDVAARAELERALAIERAQDGDRSDWTGRIEAALAAVAAGAPARSAGG